MSQALTVLLYTQEQAFQFLQDQPNAERLYPLTPNAQAAIIGHTHHPILLPLTVFSDYTHQQIVERVHKNETTLFSRILSCQELSTAGKEVFRNTFHIFANVVFYLYESLRNTGPWLIHDGHKWHRLEDLDKAVELIFQYIYDRGYGIFGLRLDSSQKLKPLLRIFNFILLKCFVKPRHVWLTGYEYNLKDISEEISISGKNITVLYPGFAASNSVLRSLRTLVEQLFPNSRSKSAIEYFPVLSTKQDYSVLFSKLLGEHPIFNSSLISRTCVNFINGYVSYTEAMVRHFDALFKSIKPERIIAHQLRWLSAPALAEIAQLQNIKCTLISHGSHGIPENPTAQREQDHLANGLLVSPLASQVVAQSPIAEQVAAQLAPTLKRYRSQPIVWGCHIPPPECQKTVFTILHAGTYKVLGSRPWIYETSNEFVHGLQQLIQAIRGIDNIHLIIRVREEPQECTLSALECLLPQNSNWELSTTGSFRDDLKRADMLISYSSTTLEEALFARRPVGLFGGSSRYRHLSGMSELPSFNFRSAVYHLNADSLREMLCRIAAAHLNYPLSDKELQPYVWDNNVPGFQDFLNGLM